MDTDFKSIILTYCVPLLLFVNLYACSETSNLKSKNNTCLIDGWEPYKTDTCIKIFPLATQNYSVAEEMCQFRGQIITIDSAEKQNFVEDYIKSRKVKENIWIGLKYSKDKKLYRWPNERTVDYFSNWGIGEPKNDPKHCVELKTTASEFGKWSSNLCEHKGNKVICERIQKWSIEELQIKVMHLNQDKIQLESKIKHLMNNKIPIGFVYVQLPKEKPPIDIWPSYRWKNVSPDYAGIFFRVEGGTAGEFGTVQEQSTERITWAESEFYKNEEARFKGITLHNGGWSSPLEVGGIAGKELYIRFLVNKTEVRPRNMAVKIWKRYG